MKTLVTLLVSISILTDVLASTIPKRAAIYKNDLTRIARYFNGLDAPVSLYAAQIHQESAWRPDAKSRYALGLAQFTPGTAKWITRYSKEFKSNAPLNPKWAMRALIVYDNYLLKHVHAIDECNKHAFALSAYNGGLGWVNRDKKMTKSNNLATNVWWGNVEKLSPRSRSAYKENRHYVKVILKKYIGLYHKNLWGGPLICQSSAIPGGISVIKSNGKF